MRYYSTTRRIAGVDEAGRGPLAGPVVAAAVVLDPLSYDGMGIHDSKKLSARKREKLSEVIRQNALSISVCAVGPRRIEAMNIREATKWAMSYVASRVQADHVLVDGNMRINLEFPSHETCIKGDGTFIEIAAASIIAKVTRDRMMKLVDLHYPLYGFTSHQGYPTAAHRLSLIHI